MSLKEYNVKENYNHAGTRKIPFYKMDEAELVEALTPEESGKLERVTFWEFNDIRKHPGVKETVCMKSPPPCGDITPMEVVSNSRAEPQS